MTTIALHLRDNEIIHWEGPGDYTWNTKGNQLYYYCTDLKPYTKPRSSRARCSEWDNYDIAYHLDGDVIFDILMAAIATDANPNDKVARTRLHEALQKILSPAT